MSCCTNGNKRATLNKMVKNTNGANIRTKKRKKERNEEEKNNMYAQTFKEWKHSPRNNRTIKGETHISNSCIPFCLAICL